MDLFLFLYSLSRTLCVVCIVKTYKKVRKSTKHPRITIITIVCVSYRKIRKFKSLLIILLQSGLYLNTFFYVKLLLFLWWTPCMVSMFLFYHSELITANLIEIILHTHTLQNYDFFCLFVAQSLGEEDYQKNVH